MMRALTRFLRGSARFCAVGDAPERLLNALARMGVPFRGVEKRDEFTLLVTVRARDAERLRRAARRLAMDVGTPEVRGAPALMRRVRRRPALVICAALLLALTLISSLFVWEIDISGNERVSDGEILRALADCGVEIGAFWPSFSGDLIRNGVIMRLPELSWLAVNVDSSRAEVIVRESVSAPELYDRLEPVDIVAAATGIIMGVSVLEGTALVEPGDAVLAGETLVTGARVSISDETRYVHARANVTARTWYELTAVGALREYEKTYTGRERDRWALLVGSSRINFYANSGNKYAQCDKIIRLYPAAIKGVFRLPFSLVRESCAEYELTETDADVAALQAELEDALLRQLGLRLDGRGEPVSASFDAYESGGALVVTLRAECLEDIALEAPAIP